jgi:hypothetical protein
MSSSRTHEFCLEVCECAAEAVDLIEEFQTASAHGGAGVHRDPLRVLAELSDVLVSLKVTARDARDAADEH